MPFDFKKEYKEFYIPKNKPEIVNVPKSTGIVERKKMLVVLKRVLFAVI